MKQVIDNSKVYDTSAQVEISNDVLCVYLDDYNFELKTKINKGELLNELFTAFKNAGEGKELLDLVKDLLPKITDKE